MAAKEINLMPDKLQLSPDEVKKRQLVKRVAFIAMGVFTLLLTLAYGSSFFIKQQLTATEKAIESEKTKISRLEKNEGLYLLLKQKTAIIKTILAQRYNFIDVFTFFKEMENKGGRIRTITIAETGDVLVNVVVTDTTALDSYVNELLAAGGTRFGHIEMQGIQFSPSGNFGVIFAIRTANRKPT